jgi:hypothetical protein
MADLTEFFHNVRNRTVALGHVFETGLLTPAQQEADLHYFVQCLHYFRTVSSQFPPEVTADVVADFEATIELLEGEPQDTAPPTAVMRPPVFQSGGPGRPRFDVPDAYLHNLAQAPAHNCPRFTSHCTSHCTLLQAALSNCLFSSHRLVTVLPCCTRHCSLLPSCPSLTVRDSPHCRI